MEIPAYLLNYIKNTGKGGGVEPTGTINITENGTVDVTNYAKANVNVSSSVTIQDCRSLFASNYRKNEIQTLLPLCKPTNCNGMFSSTTGLTEIPYFDTSNCTDFNYMCSNTSNLVTFPEIDMSGLPFTTITSSCYGMFQACSNLSNESLNNILASILTATNLIGTKSLSYLGLSQTQAETCTTLSNWQACVNAGWSTGY